MAPIVTSKEATSSTFVNNDWINLVALRGKDGVASDDIQELGKAIGVSFQGNSHNMFNVLSRSKHVPKGPAEVSEEVVLGAVEGRE